MNSQPDCWLADMPDIEMQLDDFFFTFSIIKIIIQVRYLDFNSFAQRQVKFKMSTF